MARKKTAAPKHVEPEEESQSLPEEEPETEDDEPEAGGKAISKAALRDALEQGEESPDDGVAYIRKIHGIEISKQMFSSYKTKEKARKTENQEPAAPKGKPGRKPKAAGGETDLLAAMEAMKPLVAALGADKVKRIADLLS